MERSLFQLLLLVAIGLFHCCHGDRELLKVAYGNIKRESFTEPTTVEIGAIPDWLDGTFIRQSCGAFGEVDSAGQGFQEQGLYNYIDHLFDCYNSGTNFVLQDGAATFTNRFWPTAIKRVYDDFSQNMNVSEVFHRGVLANFDINRKKQLEPNVTQYRSRTVPEQFPQVNFWQIGNRVAAWDEGPIGQWIDVHTVEGLGSFPFVGDNIFSGTRVVTNPAHEHHDEEGNLWSMAGVYTMTDIRVGMSEWIIYKVTADRERTVMARPKIGDYDISECVGTDPYPNLEARQGYIHSFGITQDYIVIPMSSWLSDPCSIFVHGTYREKPYFEGVFDWYEDHPSSLIVIRMSDGQHMGTVRTTSFFVTHMMNSYQEGELIHMDMLVYKNSSAYQDTTRIDSLLDNDLMESILERMTINMTDWSLTRRSLRQRGSDKMEMTNVNPNYVGKPYTYGYLIINPFIMGGRILKLNVVTGEETVYLLPHGHFPMEPIFVSRPGSTQEDDGILLIQGIDANKEIAFLNILDARTMSLEAHVLAQELALFGLHNRFYPCTVGGSSDDDTSTCKVDTTLLLPEITTMETTQSSTTLSTQRSSISTQSSAVSTQSSPTSTQSSAVSTQSSATSTQSSATSTQSSSAVTTMSTASSTVSSTTSTTASSTTSTTVSSTTSTTVSPTQPSPAITTHNMKWYMLVVMFFTSVYH